MKDEYEEIPAENEQKLETHLKGEAHKSSNQAKGDKVKPELRAILNRGKKKGQ